MENHLWFRDVWSIFSYYRVCGSAVSRSWDQKRRRKQLFLINAASSWTLIGALQDNGFDVISKQNVVEIPKKKKLFQVLKKILSERGTFRWQNLRWHKGLTFSVCEIKYLLFSRKIPDFLKNFTKGINFWAFIGKQVIL